MWLPMIQSNLKVSCSIIISQWHDWDFKPELCLPSSTSICLQAFSCAFRPSRTESTTSVCKARRPGHRRLPCANGSSAPSLRWLRWRSSRQRPPHSFTPCDLLCDPCMHLPWLIPVTKRHADAVVFIWTEILLAPSVKYLYMYSKSMLF